jgi:intracellular septation protein
MNALFDFFPIIIFFIAFKIYGIYIATAAVIVASTLQIAIFWLRFRRFELTHVITFAIVFILGGATIITKDPSFIKWKPTVVSWLMVTVFIGMHFFGKKSLLQYMLDKKITLEKAVWNKLNWNWMIFLTLVGAINLYVAYHFSTAAWVNFKVFGVLGATIIFSVLQSIYINKHMTEQPQQEIEK